MNRPDTEPECSCPRCEARAIYRPSKKTMPPTTAERELLLDLENERRENDLLKESVIALKAEVETAKIKYMNHDLMAGCMDMTRQGLIDAGIFGDSVPPMFVTEAILGYIGKLKNERAQIIAELREIADDICNNTYTRKARAIINKYETL